MNSEQPDGLGLRGSALAMGCMVLSTAMALACTTGRGGDRNLSPIFDTGVGATVIEPGGNLPSMPPPVYRSQNGAPTPSANTGPQSGDPNLQQGGPGSYSRSSRGGAQGSSPSGASSQGGATIIPPGGAQQGGYPAQPPSGPQMVSIGGASTIDTRTGTGGRRNPILGAAGAAAGWPIRKLSTRTTGRSTRSDTNGPNAAPAPAPEPVDPELASERARIEALERELPRQAPHSGARSEPKANEVQQGRTQNPQHARADNSWTIADELAALRSGKHPQQTRSVSAPPPLHRTPVARGTAAVFDRNADGTADHWLAPTPDGGLHERFDDDDDGRVDREIWTDAHKVVVRSAEDQDRNGHLDSWTQYEGGLPTRRRSDFDGDGIEDTWTFFNGGNVSRLERDTDGDGYRDQIDFYRDGLLAHRTEDTNGDGRPERITRFDQGGQPSEREEDRDDDGVMDVRSHYDSGRLVRRELLDDQETLP